MSGIAVAIMPDAGPPQVGITVTGLDGLTPSVITIDTSWDGGSSWHPVRGAVGISVLSGTFVRDHVPALNMPVTYRLTVVSGSTVPGTLEVTLTVPSASGWLQDPIQPRDFVAIDGRKAADALTLMHPSASELMRRQSADVVAVEGAAYPVASVGTRLAPSSVPLVLRAVTRSQGELIDALRALLYSAGVLVIRGLPADVPLDPVANVVAGDVSEVPVLGNVLGLRNDWRLDVTVVRPSSMQVAVPWWSYNQVAADWSPTTYDGAKAARPGATYLDWARDPEPPA